MLLGLALLVAPVEMSRVDVTWPREPDRVESTALLLANQSPHAIEVGFGGEVVSALEDGEVLLATIRPELADARASGLVVERVGSDVVVTIRGHEVAAPVEAATSWRVLSTVEGAIVTLDGEPIARWDDVLPPQIDALMSDVRVVADPEDLAVHVQVVDDADSTPGRLKVVLMIALWLAFLAALVLLWRDDRLRTAARASVDRVARFRFAPADLVVALVLAAWVALGPMTDDDGYYATMSSNAGASGYVGNYFQMFDQPFTPFTWFWWLLEGWQAVGGRSPVWLRLPALLAAIACWLVIRWVFDAAIERTAPASRRRLGRVLLALAFLAWWLPYSMGSRPEILGALGGALVVALVLRAVSTRTLLPAAAAALVAGLAFAAHPTGIVAFAPLVVALPSLWRIARADGGVGDALLRTCAVFSAAGVALFAAFADGTLRDLVTGRALFGSVETPLGPRDELLRYKFLLDDIPMGSYAKRVAVLVALMLVLWFVALAVTARVRRGRLPLTMQIVGWSLPISLAALVITPSKWTHHFGAIAGIGPLFIAVLLVCGPAVVMSVARGERLPRWVSPAVVVSLVPVAVVSLAGPNQWAYAWDIGMPNRGDPPHIGALALSSIALWAAIAAVVLCLVWWRERPRGPLSLAPAGMAIAVIGTSTAYLTATFTIAALPGTATSVGAANLADPIGSQCLISRAVGLWDAAEARPLEPVSEAPVASDGFTEEPADSGDAATDRPAPSLRVWLGDGTAAADLVSPLYRLPRVSASERLVVLTRGDVSPASANRVSLEFVDDAGAPLTAIPLGDWAERVGWVTLAIAPSAIPDDAVAVRVTGHTPGGASPLAVSAPAVASRTSLHDAAPSDAPTAVAWTSTFWFPCERPMEIADGIIEPPVLATTFGVGPPDNIWRLERGGSLAGVARLATVRTPATELAGMGDLWGRVQLFTYPVALREYDVTTTRVPAWGWESPFGELPQLVGR